MEREELEKLYGQVWDTQQLQDEFEVHGFHYGRYVTVTRKADNVKGSMVFQHMPRYYYQFEESPDERN